MVYLSTIGAQASQPNLLTRHTIIGKLAAALLQETVERHRVVELEGAHCVTPNEIAAAFTKVLGRSVQMQIVPRDSWEDLFKSQGMKNPLPRMQMLNGFNEGWIEFESGETGSRKGVVSLEPVLQGLIQ